MSEPCCPRCKRPWPDGWSENLHKRRSDSIKAAFAKVKAEGGRVGRKRKTDYMEIVQLSKSGMGTTKIAGQLKISRGSVQHALRLHSKEPK